MGPSGYSKTVSFMVDMVNPLIPGNKLLKYCSKLTPSEPIINSKSHLPQGFS